MSERHILITAPSLYTKNNVSGISSVTNFIIDNNLTKKYKHFELGRKDEEKRNLIWFFKYVVTNFKWAAAAISRQTAIIHFNFALSKASIIRDAPLIIFAKWFKKKIVIHTHGGDYLLKETPPSWMKFLVGKVFSNNTPIIVLSPLEQQAIVERYKVTNTNVLPNCVDVKDAISFKRNFETEKELKILFIGRISLSKGIDKIYAAFEKLKSANVPFKFYMAGAGPEEKEYVQKFAELLKSNFEFKGVVSGQVKANLFKGCNVFLLPSLFEALPMSLLESMSYGLVPLVTDVGSIKYVVNNNENGIILKDNPVQEIVDGVLRLQNENGLLKNMSIKASNFIFNNYNPKDYILSLNKIYASL